MPSPLLLMFNITSVFYTKGARKELKMMDCGSVAMIYAWIAKNLEGTDDPYRTG